MCGFLNGHLNSKPSKISEKVSGWVRFCEHTLYYHSILNPRSAQAFYAQARRSGVAPSAPEYFVPQTLSSYFLFAAAALMDK
jgi:hypothetical protein